MYSQIKNLLRTLIPIKWLFRFEPALRSVLYLFYRGNDFECNVCGKKLRKFIPLKEGDNLCPSCGSLSRTRRLFALLEEEFLRTGMRVLDFSPSRSLFRALKKRPDIHYSSSDISGDFLADFQYDIRDIPEGSDSYDLIICFHVLEHIDDDRRAMRELYRVLKKGGTCLVQTPFKEGDIYENPLITSESDRLAHFGQEDHVRIYSAEGLRDRLAEAGFQAEIREFSEQEGNRSGYKMRERALVCRKV